MNSFCISCESRIAKEIVNIYKESLILENIFHIAHLKFHCCYE